MTAPAATAGNYPVHELAEASLLAETTRMAPAGVRFACRAVRTGDEAHLLPAERLSVTTRDPAARRASGAARHAARGLLADFGFPGFPIGRESSGQPIWPQGIIGSLAHDSDMAVVAVGRSAAISSIGVDVEPAEPLPDDVLSLVMAAGDVLGTAGGHLAARVLFAAKEAIYKAVHPLDGIALEYDQIHVNLIASRGSTCTGRQLSLHWCVAPRIVILAII